MVYGVRQDLGLLEKVEVQWYQNVESWSIRHRKRHLSGAIRISFKARGL